MPFQRWISCRHPIHDHLPPSRPSVRRREQPMNARSHIINKSLLLPDQYHNVTVLSAAWWLFLLLAGEVQALLNVAFLFHPVVPSLSRRKEHLLEKVPTDNINSKHYAVPHQSRSSVLVDRFRPRLPRLASPKMCCLGTRASLVVAHERLELLPGHGRR
jgi:hypothetical protein